MPDDLLVTIEAGGSTEVILDWQASRLSQLSGLTEENAKDKLFSQIGSKNRIKRGQIKIQSIESVPFADVTDPLIERIIKSDFKIPFEE